MSVEVIANDPTVNVISRNAVQVITGDSLSASPSEPIVIAGSTPTIVAADQQTIIVRQPDATLIQGAPVSAGGSSGSIPELDTTGIADGDIITYRAADSMLAPRSPATITDGGNF